MLGNSNAIANIAVRDLEAAYKFYQDTLGLKPFSSEGDEAVVFKSGNTSLIVYRSQFAGTNQATAVTWTVNDVQKAVNELKAKGLCFEHYDMPGMQREGDVHVAGEMRIAWFKDPDGNILAIANG